MMKKYQIDTEENKKFLNELQRNLLNFGKKFLSPGGSAYFLDTRVRPHEIPEQQIPYKIGRSDT